MYIRIRCVCSFQGPVVAEAGMSYGVPFWDGGWGLGGNRFSHLALVQVTLIV